MREDNFSSLVFLFFLFINVKYELCLFLLVVCDFSKASASALDLGF